MDSCYNRFHGSSRKILKPHKTVNAIHITAFALKIFFVWFYSMSILVVLFIRKINPFLSNQMVLSNYSFLIIIIIMQKISAKRV